MYNKVVTLVGKTKERETQMEVCLIKLLGFLIQKADLASMNLCPVLLRNDIYYYKFKAYYIMV